MSDIKPDLENFAKAVLTLAMARHIEELEAKLAKAVEALVQMVGKNNYADDPWEIASATLAELKGDKT